MTGEEATFTVAGRVVVPGVTATVLTMVVPAGTLSTVGAEEGGIFWVAAAAAANAAMPLICGLLPMTCSGRREREPAGGARPEATALHAPRPSAAPGRLALKRHLSASGLPGPALLTPDVDAYHRRGTATRRQELPVVLDLS